MRYPIETRYNKDTDNPIYTIFDSESQTFEEVVVPREDSYSYFLQQNMTKQEVREILREMDIDSLARVVEIVPITKHNLFTDEDEELMKVKMESAMDVKTYRFNTCHEGHIKRVTRHMLDKKWYIGMPCDDNNRLIPVGVGPKYRDPLIAMGYPEDVVDQFLGFMFADIPEISTMSLDIETESFGTVLPNPMYASTPIISSAFKFHDVITNETTGIVVLLEDDLRRYVNKDINYSLRELVIQGKVKLEIYKTEYDLVMRIIEILKDPRYPLCVTYFGEGFDLPYIYNRAINLGINRNRIPFTAYRSRTPQRTRGARTDWRVKMKNKMHIDMLQFFSQPTIQNYVFKNKYKKLGLDPVARGLIGRGKVEHEESINDLSMSNLAYYNYIDADLTLDLMRQFDYLPLKITFMFMRIGRQGYYDAAHRAIGTKILNMAQGYMVERNILIPNRSDLSVVGTAHSSPDVKGKGYRGAVVIPTEKGLFVNIKRVDFASLYPTMMKEKNISFDTVNCNHPECRVNLVPELPHHICTKKIGIIPTLIGCLKDTRLLFFKPWSNDKSLPEKERNTYKAIEQAIKVYVNACLPHNEEVITLSKEGIVNKQTVGSLASCWKDRKILSIENDQNSSKFGHPVFIEINGVVERGIASIVEITLSDGRSIRCTENHVFPKSLPKHIRKTRNYDWKEEFQVKEVQAAKLEVGDEIFVLNNIPLSSTPPEILFIPDIIFTNNLSIALPREEFKKHAYKKNQRNVTDPLTSLFIKKSEYENIRKRYRINWNKLSETEKETVRNNYRRIEIKIKPSGPGYWYPSFLRIEKNLLKLLGWYIAEGSIDVKRNRFCITQCNLHSPENVEEIKEILKHLGFRFSYSINKQFEVNSNVYSMLLEALCGRGSKNKRIPLHILNRSRAETLLDAYFKGDGNWTNIGAKRYSTISKQLSSDLLTVIGALKRNASIHEEGIFRVVETKGMHYTRYKRGMVDFNGTVIVRIKKIEKLGKVPVIDIETENGWFVTTNGIVTHNSYGVSGFEGFGLFCEPVAESITSFSRNAITRLAIETESLIGNDLRKIAEEHGVDPLDALEYIPREDKLIIGGDTDSLMGKFTEKQIEHMVKFSQEVLNTELALEITAALALFYKKKNYILVEENGNVEVKGMLGKKRNTPPIAVQCFEKFKIILVDVVTKDEPIDGIREKTVDLIREFYDMIWEGKGNIKDYVFEVKMTKAISEYKASPQHVKAAKKWAKHVRKNSASLRTASDNTIVPVGSVIGYVKKAEGGVKTTRSGKRASGVKCDPIPIQIATKKDISPIYYHENLLSVMGQVMDALEINREEVITTDPSQSTLDTFF